MILCVLIAVLSLNSCKKEDTDDYFKKSDFIAKSSGYINVKIIGTSYDGIALNETYTADYLSPFSSFSNGYYYEYYGIQIFRISRNNNITDNSISVNLSFQFDQNTVTNCDINVYIQKKLENGDILNLNLPFPENQQITDFTFDPATGICKGNFTASYKYENTAQSTVSVSGDFNVNIVKEISK
jgi:hypothetical protein